MNACEARAVLAKRSTVSPYFLRAHPVCFACSDVDGRNYDWQGLAEAADLFFVMSYDMQVRPSRGMSAITDVFAALCTLCQRQG